MNLINKGNERAGKINMVLGFTSDSSIGLNSPSKKKDSLTGYFIFLTILITIFSSFYYFLR